ncbi:transglycosylase SLT domain-containing protein [Alcaligenaceae bacterium A4P071]|nr:transglycosylase SLT domain-containing protein [Alcaligenaceae bacterium A4P071]
MNALRLFIPLLLAALAGCSGVPQKPDEKLVKQPGYTDRYIARDTSRTVDLTHPPTDAWERIRRGFAIPNMDTALTQQWTDYYASHPESMYRMTQRAGKYLYYVIEEINRRGLPTELALLPFVESAYNPTALSSARAAGLWQFVPATGTQFNLKQDWWLDERRDPVASTNAALDYLEYLFNMQGDWYLALASYNWGEGSVRRAMDKNSTAGLATDYLSLNMPDETRNYVPKLQAIKNILANPQKYAVTLPPVSNTPYFVTVRKNKDMDVSLAAKLAEMPEEEFKALNPSFNRPIIRGEHSPALLLPADRLERFNANIEAYEGELSTWKVYSAQKGESFASIAQRHGVSESVLRSVNGVAGLKRTAAAQTLLVPGKNNVQLASLETPSEAVEAVSSSRTRAVVVVPANRNPRNKPNVRTHRVKNGDTLFGIAQKYNTSVDALRALNNLKGKNANLKIGSSLRIPGTNVRG